MKKGNFKILSGFEYWAPGWKGVFGLLLWLFVGALIGNVLVFLLGMLLGPAWAADYSTVIAYPVMFLPPMFYARSKSIKCEMKGRAPKPLNKGHFAPLGPAICALLVTLITLAAGYIADPIVTLLPPMPEFLEQALNSMVQGNVLINLLCVSIFAPFF